MKLTLVERADLYATAAHEGQVRKYTGEPYIEHPRAVAFIVRTVTTFEPVIAAALLHDVIEDCGKTKIEIETEFGRTVATLVWELTDQYTDLSLGNRAARKEMERTRLSGISAAAQTIKVADMIDNARSVTLYDPGFAKVYMDEKLRLIKRLPLADPNLLRSALSILRNYYFPNAFEPR